MKKILIAVSVLVVLGILAVPGIAGMQAEEQYKGFTSRFAASGLKIKRNDYQRDWFQANAETEVEFMLPEQPGGGEATSFSFIIKSEITHGPFSMKHGFSQHIASIETRLLFDDDSFIPAGYPAHIKTLVGLDGGGKVTLDFPAYERPAKEGQPAVDFTGAKGEVVFTAGYNKVVANFSLPRLYVKEEGELSIEISEVVLNSDVTRGIEDLMLGGGTFSIGSIRVVLETAGADVDLRNLRFKYSASAANNMVDTAVSYNLDTVSTQGKSFGPMALDFRVSNLSAAVVASFQQALEEISSQHLPPSQQAMVILGVMMSSGSEFLKSDPKIALEKLHVVTPDGIIEGNFQVQSEDLQWADIGNIGVVLKKLIVDARLRMPEKFLRAAIEQQSRQSVIAQINQQRQLGEQVPDPDPEQLKLQTTMMAGKQIETLLAQEFLVRDGSDIATIANLQDGLLSVNGKSIPLPMVVQ